MGIIEDIENILLRKHELLGRLLRDEISIEEYNQDATSLDSAMETYSRMPIKSMLESKQKSLDEEEEDKMPKEAEGTVKKRGRPIKADSAASLAVKALQMKSLKNLDATVTKILEWSPDKDPEKLKTQVRLVIYNVKKGKGRWAAYCWDQENYLLTLKQTSC